MIDTGDFKTSLGALLAETFGVSEQPHGFFLDSGDAGLIGTLGSISAAAASTSLPGGDDTIAAHCGHVLYQLHLFQQYEQGKSPAVDWPGSWKTAEIDDTRWEKLRAELVESYESVVTSIRERDEWPQPAVGAAMMLLAHCAYHVGVIHKVHSVISA